MPPSGTVPRRAPGVRALCPSHVHCPQVAQNCSNQMGCCRGRAGAEWCNNAIGTFGWVGSMACSVDSPVVRSELGSDNGTRSSRPVWVCSTGWCSRSQWSRAACWAPARAARRDLSNEPRIAAGRDSTPERGAAMRGVWPAQWHRLARVMHACMQCRMRRVRARVTTAQGDACAHPPQRARVSRWHDPASPPDERQARAAPAPTRLGGDPSLGPVIFEIRSEKL